LLATGYGRILSYSLASNLKAEEVRRAALGRLTSRGQKNDIRGIRLAFVPFYRLTGLDFSWSWKDKEITSPLLETPHASNAALRTLRFGEEALKNPNGGPLPPLKEKEYLLTSIYLDRTFLAADLPSLSLRSLGVRSQVRTLHLFDPEALSREGQVIPVTMDWKEAWNRIETGLPLENLTRRLLINRILSLVFFPLWEVQVDSGARTSSLLFDGVARSFLQEEAASRFFSESPAGSGFSAQTLRFRPLACPNCGGGLPVDRDFRLFSCPTCHRLWHIKGDEFENLPYRLAEAPKRLDPRQVHYLPFWIFLGQVHLEGRTIASKYDLAQLAPQARLLREEDKAIPLRFFVPAFKVRDLSVANRLSTSFTRMQPLFQVKEPSGESLHPGGVLDRDEAATFAHLSLVSITPKGNPKLVERVAQAELTLSPGELVFFPFQDHLDSLREDFLGTAIHKATLR